MRWVPRHRPGVGLGTCRPDACFHTTLRRAASRKIALLLLAAAQGVKRHLRYGVHTQTDGIGIGISACPPSGPPRQPGGACTTVAIVASACALAVAANSPAWCFLIRSLGPPAPRRTGRKGEVAVMKVMTVPHHHPPSHSLTAALWQQHKQQREARGGHDDLFVRRVSANTPPPVATAAPLLPALRGAADNAHQLTTPPSRSSSSRHTPATSSPEWVGGTLGRMPCPFGYTADDMPDYAGDEASDDDGSALTDDDGSRRDMNEDGESDVVPSPRGPPRARKATTKAAPPAQSPGHNGDKKKASAAAQHCGLSPQQHTGGAREDACNAARLRVRLPPPPPLLRAGQGADPGRGRGRV